MPLLPPSRAAAVLAIAVLGAPLGGCTPTVEPPQGQRVEQVAGLSQKPGNPAVTAGGRLFFTMHPLDRPTYKLMERRADGSVVPFPDPETSRTAFDNPLGLRASWDGLLWILDMGDRAGSAAHPATRPPRLIGWDLQGGAPARVIALPPEVLRPNSWPQDFALDQTHGMAFVADAMRADLTRDDPPAIIAVALRTGAARRLLEGHESFQPAPLPAVASRGGLPTATGADGRERSVRFGLNPITSDPRDEWVYWGAGTGFGIYRARAADLADPDLPAAELARRVERHRDKPASDGISVDGAGNIYVTDVVRGAVGVSTADGYRVLARDPRMIWPDGLAFGPDGLLYVTVSQFGRMPVVNGGQDRGEPPYVVLRLRPLAPSAVGR